MRRIYASIVLALALSVSACGTHIKPIPPAPLTVADASVQVYVSRTVGILDSLGDVTADVSRAERQLYAAGSIPLSLHTQLRAGIVAVSNKGLATLDQIEKGVSSWVQLKAYLDPLIADVNSLIALVQGAGGGVRAKLGQILEGLSGPLGELLFGGAR